GNLGRNDEAIGCYDKLINFLEEIGLVVVKRDVELCRVYARALYNKGGLKYMIDEYKNALYCFNKSKEINQEFFLAWYMKGQCHIKLGEKSESEDSFNECFKIIKSYAEKIDTLKKFWEFEKEINYLRRLMFHMFYDYERLEKLEEEFQEILSKVKEKIKIPIRSFINSYLIRGKSLGKSDSQEDKLRALEYLDIAFKEAKKFSYYFYCAQVYFAKGEIKESAQKKGFIDKEFENPFEDYEEGIRYFERFYKIFQKIGAGEREVYFVPFWRFYERVCNLTLARNYKEAFNYREKMAAQNIIDYLENASLNLIEEEKREKIKELLKEWTKKCRELEGIEDEKEFSKVNKERDNIEDELIKIGNEIALEASYFNISLDIDISKIQESLKPEEMILEYYYESKDIDRKKEGEEKIEIDKLHIWIIDKEKIKYREIDFKEPFIMKEKDWEEILGLEKWKEITKKFYENLIKPIEKDIFQKVIYIVPYRALWNLPFNWLWDGRRFLSERFVISCLPSASLLFVIRNRNKEDVKKEEFLAIMKENYEKEGLGSFSGAEKNFQNILKKFNGKEENIINIDKKATKKKELLAAIKKLKKDKSLNPSKVYLVINFHGRIDQKANNSYFVLNENEKLYCEELMEIGNWGIDTAFLISCWSGKKINLGDYGDMFINFVASLMAIGCKRVMAPIVKIESQSAIEYLKDFFDLFLGKKYLFIKIRKPLKKVLVELFKREIKKYRKQPVKKWPLFLFFGLLP
ncbi:MAG: CHAT domain-containing protein, partial [Candidatus Aenigmatarchaeota archaeon]